GTQAIDISQGGLRIYGDDPMSPGDHLEIELFLPDQSTVTCEVEIVWVDPLPDGAPARFDMGLKFLHPNKADMDRRAAVLAKTPAWARAARRHESMESIRSVAGSRPPSASRWARRTIVAEVTKSAPPKSSSLVMYLRDLLHCTRRARCAASRKKASSCESCEP